MLTMQSNEAKTHFAGVLREVEEGQEILITKHKKVIAKIIPYSEESTDPKAAVEAVKALKKLNLTQKEIGEYRTTGRL
ncbi:MAG: type II toxin-antitoxin system prevent-host-death family antitoxin [Gammaproteobacteria bacterium]|jgi:prevent-host-death family protein|nr:type II toxin-antitoxin system prevent-host-death family antitoxin [Gammaproteobacteria bacterium]MBT3490520.1 type II toxin-antitoxin system prevent-host-death family antitoxin [Gammaproteobacteria bacterium]MBT3717544.1 type II toxin-antitoxin system prevent-host-death family antitoxin [Gammaproteobacteria bacterium]MBT3845220.1 type II toxin-antitoxin system prevent-host-death family antitoxin [Gammaproteobacteria bacterium]MBT3892078.1 type II toxin-antitoxin system prevent-host-death fa